VSFDNSWQLIQLELSQIVNNGEYKLLQPLLEGLQSLVAAKYPTPEIVRGLLDVVKQIQVETSQGGNPRELAKQIALGFIQPQWNVQGSVNQANRDLFNQFVIQFFSSNLSELERSQPSPSLLLPIVLIVMNASEAKSLASGDAFHGYPEELCQDFKKLRVLLEERNSINWVERYHNIPQSWQPFRDTAENIEQIIKRTLGMVEGYQNLVSPVFVDIRMLNATDNRRALRELRSYGCVVIMDVISMHHPVIQREFRQSLLDAFPNTMVARVAPISDALQVVQRMISFIERHIDLECHKRFKLDFDELCDEVSDSTRFGRWLKNHVNNLLPDDAKSQVSSRKYWYQMSGVD
jgi:hypothetical protein